VFGGAIVGIFRNKAPGFGKYTTSALLADRPEGANGR